MSNVCSGLEILHQHGYIHHDISADNVMLADDGFVLIDFGSALPWRSVFHRTRNPFLSAMWPQNPPEYKAYLRLPPSDIARGYADFPALRKAARRFWERKGCDRGTPQGRATCFGRAAALKSDVFALGVTMLQIIDAFGPARSDPAAARVLRNAARSLAEVNPGRRPDSRAAARLLDDALSRLGAGGL